MTTTTAPERKPIPVVLSLTLTYEAKAGMTFGEFEAEAAKAKKIIEETAKHGAVKGTVKIGSQKFKV